MASDIEWTDETWNPTTGCTPVSAGCLNCYAATFAHRGLTESHRGLTALRDGRAVFNGKIKLHEERLKIPLGWKNPRRVFVDSMSDLFHAGVPFDFVDRVFAVMALCPQHTFQILTKRPERMAEYLNSVGRGGDIAGADPCPTRTRERFEPRIPTLRADEMIPLSNVWLGTSIENQDTADERIPHLLKCPAVVRFLSYEPALGPVRIRGEGCAGCFNEGGVYAGHLVPCRFCCPIDWVIAGGESGHGSRPANIEWFRSARDQCKAAGIPFFMKQLGAIAAEMDSYPLVLRHAKGGDPSEWPADLRVREFPAVTR